jgi:hypothetical protein
MVKKKESKPLIEKHGIAGHSIEIRKKRDVEQLLIDGIPHRFFMRDDGYVIYENAYGEPQKALIEAVKMHFQGASAKSDSK